MSEIPIEQYQQRRQALLSQLPEQSLVLLPAAQLLIRNHDVHFPYREDSDFYYLTGLEEPTAVVALYQQGRHLHFELFVRPRDPQLEQWDGLRIGPEGACRDYGASEAYSIDELKPRLSQLFEGRQRIYWPIGRNPTFDQSIIELANEKSALARRGVCVPSEFHNIEPYLHQLRLIKSEQEIAIMRHVAAFSADAQRNAMAACKPGMYEYELEAILLHEYMQQGSRAVAYQSIVAGGKNACVLHYVTNQAKLNEGDLVLIDAGAEYKNYAADITRTYPVGKNFTAAQQALYEIVLAAQLAAIDLAKPGLPWNEMQNKIVEIMVQGLVDLKILKGNIDDLIRKKAYQDYYMHTSGHWLGLDVHDVGAYKQGEQWQTLQQGMVFTIEPGLYLTPGDELDPQWWNIGIRIEDDIALTTRGTEVLTAGAPKHIDDILSLKQ